MRQKGKCQVGFIVKAVISFMDSDPFHLSFSSLFSQESKSPEFFGSSVLLAANLLTLCKEVSWVTASVILLTCSVWHFECLCSCVPIEVRVLWKPVKALYIPSCKRIRGGISWLAIGKNSSIPWIPFMGHDWCGFSRQNYYLSFCERHPVDLLEKQQKEFSGILVELPDILVQNRVYSGSVCQN